MLNYLYAVLMACIAKTLDAFEYFIPMVYKAVSEMCTAECDNYRYAALGIGTGKIVEIFVGEIEYLVIVVPDEAETFIPHIEGLNV